MRAEVFTEHRPGGEDHDQKNHGRRGLAVAEPQTPPENRPGGKPWWEMSATEFTAHYPDYAREYGMQGILGLTGKIDTWMRNSMSLRDLVSPATWERIPRDMRDVRWTTIDPMFLYGGIDSRGISDFRFKVPTGADQIEVPPLMMLSSALTMGEWDEQDGDYTVAHELGHIAFGRSGKAPLSRVDSEQFANLYAERLLGRLSTHSWWRSNFDRDTGELYTQYGDQVMPVSRAAQEAADHFFPPDRQPKVPGSSLRLMSMLTSRGRSQTREYLEREAAGILLGHQCEHGIVFVQERDEVATEAELFTEHIFPPPSEHGPGDPQLTHGRYKGGARTRIGVAPGEAQQKMLGQGVSMQRFAQEDPEAYRIIHDSGLTIERLTVGRGYWSEGQQQSEYDLDLVVRGNPELAELVARALQDHWKQTEVLAWHYDGKGKVPTASFRLAPYISRSEGQVELERVMAKHMPEGWHLSFDSMGQTRQMFVSRSGDSDSAAFLDRINALHRVLAREGFIAGHWKGVSKEETGISAPIIRGARLVSFRDGKRKVWTEGALFGGSHRGGDDDAHHGRGPREDARADGGDGDLDLTVYGNAPDVQRAAARIAEGIAELLTEHIFPPPSEHGEDDQKVHGRIGNWTKKRQQDEGTSVWKMRRATEIKAILNDPDVLRARALSKSMPSTHTDNSPARKAIRAQVVDLIYGSGAPNKDRVAYIVTGLPAIGKSTIADPLAKRIGALVTKSGHIGTDNDTAKELLHQMDTKKDMTSAGAYQLEADGILKRVLTKAVRNGDNIVLPVVGKTPTSMRQYRDRLVKYGYEVHLIHFSGDPVQAAKNSLRRWKTDPMRRFVDPDYIINTVGYLPDRTFDILKSEGGFTSIERFDVKVHAAADRKRTYSSGGPGRGGVGLLPEREPSGDTGGRERGGRHAEGHRVGRSRISEGEEDDWLTPAGHDKPFTDEFDVLYASAQKEFEEPTARGIGKAAEVGPLRSVLGPAFAKDLLEVLDFPVILANRVNGQPLDGAAAGEVDGKPAFVLNPLTKGGLRALLAQAVRLRDERRLDKDALAGERADDYADAMAERFGEAIIDVREHVRMSRLGKPHLVRGHKRTLPDLKPAPSSEDIANAMISQSATGKANDLAALGDSSQRAQEWAQDRVEYESHYEKQQAAGMVKAKNVEELSILMLKDPAVKDAWLKMKGSVNEWVDARQRDWAETSSDKSYRQVAMQYAVAEEFGLPLTKIVNDSLTDEQMQHALGHSGSAWRLTQDMVRQQAATYYDEQGPLLHSFARTVYDNTQKKLAAAGVKGEVVLYRGMFDPNRGGEGALGPGEQRIYMNPLSSWSLSETTAGGFAGDSGLILAARVPVERIWSTARTGPGCLDETEFIVLGGKSERVHVTRLDTMEPVGVAKQ